MDVRAKMADLHSQSEQILARADAAEPRRDLTEAECAELVRLSGDFDQLRARLDVQERGQEVVALRGTGRRTVPDPIGGDAGAWSRPDSAGHRMFAQLFPAEAKASDSGGYDMRSFFRAALSGRYDPRLEVYAGHNEGTGSEGGFMVPTPLARDLMGAVFEASSLLPLVRRIPITSKSTVFPRFLFEDRSVNLLGGFTGTWTAESAPGTVQTGKIVSLTATAHKLMVHSKASNELLADAAMFAAEFSPALVRALSYSLDRVIVRGTGAGQPLGLLNDGSLLIQAAEGAQLADPIACTKSSTRRVDTPPIQASWITATKAFSVILRGSRKGGK